MRNRINILKQQREHLNEGGIFGLFNDAPYRDKKNIRSCDMVATNANQCKVLYDGKHVFSNARFHNGDIIEICPCREISKLSLYAREVRDMVFEVEPDTMFVIPMGYCQHYDILGKSHPVPNCNWEWNPENKTIIIRALCTIPKQSLLIIDIEK